MKFLSQLLKSKTVIVNTLTVAVGVAGYLIGHDVIAAHPDWVAALVAASGALNVVLRLITTVSVFEK